MNTFKIVHDLQEVKENKIKIDDKQVYGLEVEQEMYGDNDVIRHAVKAWITDTKGFYISSITLAEREIELIDFDYRTAIKQGKELMEELNK